MADGRTRDRLRTRLRRGLSRTRSRVKDRLSRVLRGRTQIDDDLLDDLEEILYEADVGVTACERILDGLRERVREGRIREVDGIRDALREEILEILGGAPPPVAPTGFSSTRVILVTGVNGAGKTTTIGKLADRFRRDGLQVVIAAADTFRAAAIEQLAVWSDRAGAHLVRQEIGSDAAAVAYDAFSSARAKGADVLLVDTAGRLHTKRNLMEELKKVRRVLERQDPDAPHECLLVLDGVTGQNGLIQAREFNEALGLSGIVLTKLDGTAKGGVVLAVKEEIGIPVRLVGVGEGIDDLQDFDPVAFTDALLGTDGDD